MYLLLRLDGTIYQTILKSLFLKSYGDCVYHCAAWGYLAPNPRPVFAFVQWIRIIQNQEGVLIGWHNAEKRRVALHLWHTKRNISENFHYRVCQRGHQGSYIYICLIGLNFACQVVELGTTSYILPISTTRNVTFAKLRAIEFF